MEQMLRELEWQEKVNIVWFSLMMFPRLKLALSLLTNFPFRGPF